MTEGYLYCFSNKSMPGILKIGITEETPDIILNEANKFETWKPPTPYIIEFAKKVINPKLKETSIFKILSQGNEFVNPKCGFIYAQLEEVKSLFDLIDGELWVENNYDDYNIEMNKTLILKPSKCRDASKCFKNGQRIRHVINVDKIWIGIYDSSINSIIYDNKVFQGRSPLNKFVKSHYETERKDRTSNANAWEECECEIDGKWISTYDLPSS